MKEVTKWQKTRAIILLLAMIAIGGVVIYGENNSIEKDNHATTR